MHLIVNCVTCEYGNNMKFGHLTLLAWCNSVWICNCRAFSNFYISLPNQVLHVQYYTPLAVREQLQTDYGVIMTLRVRGFNVFISIYRVNNQEL